MSKVQVLRDLENRGQNDLITQQRMMSQTTLMGASVFKPRGLACVPDMRYPAFSTADLNITADGDVHFSVPQRLCKHKNNGTSGSSCATGQMQRYIRKGSNKLNIQSKGR